MVENDWNPEKMPIIPPQKQKKTKKNSLNFQSFSSICFPNFLFFSVLELEWKTFFYIHLWMGSQLRGLKCSF